MINFIDIHTHHIAHFDGVTSVQNLSLTNDSTLRIPKEQLISIGLHPWYAKLDELDLQINNLRIFAKQPNVKFIGECGLDKLRGEILANQILILKKQVELAEELNKPLIFHCVKAYDELITLKKEMKISVPIIIHGFNKNQKLGLQLVGKGFWLSFGCAVLKKNDNLVKLIQMTDHFFLETDDSESSIEEIYHAVADIKKCTLNELKGRIFEDWKNLN